MNKYKYDSVCVKCNSSSFAFTNYSIATNSMKRTCRGCGYTWYELPLDYVEESKSSKMSELTYNGRKDKE